MPNLHFWEHPKQLHLPTSLLTNWSTVTVKVVLANSQVKWLNFPLNLTSVKGHVLTTIRFWVLWLLNAPTPSKSIKILILKDPIFYFSLFLQTSDWFSAPENKSDRLSRRVKMYRWIRRLLDKRFGVFTQTNKHGILVSTSI